MSNFRTFNQWKHEKTSESTLRLIVRIEPTIQDPFRIRDFTHSVILIIFKVDNTCEI